MEITEDVRTNPDRGQRDRQPQGRTAGQTLFAQATLRAWTNPVVVSAMPATSSSVPIATAVASDASTSDPRAMMPTTIRAMPPATRTTASCGGRLQVPAAVPQRQGVR